MLALSATSARRSPGRARRAASASLGAGHPRVATGLYGLYAALLDTGDLAGAEQALRASLAIDERHLPPGHPYLATDRQKLEELRLAASRRKTETLAAPNSSETK